jgi:hypothetical protein
VALLQTRKLRSLSLTDSELLEALPLILGQNHHLHTLSLVYCSELAFPPALPTSQSLEILEIKDCLSLDLNAFSALIYAAPNLRHFSLSRVCADSLALDCLSSLKYVETLEFASEDVNQLLLAGIPMEIGEEELWPHLRELSIEGIGDEALQVLCVVSPRLRVLHVVGGLSVTSLCTLLATLVDIEELRLMSLETLTIEVFEALCRKPPKHLATLVLQNCFLPSERELSPILNTLPILSSLKLISCHQEATDNVGHGRFQTVSERQRQHHAM